MARRPPSTVLVTAVVAGAWLATRGHHAGRLAPTAGAMPPPTTVDAIDVAPRSAASGMDRTRRMASQLLSLVAVAALLGAGVVATGAIRSDDVGEVDLAPDDLAARSTALAVGPPRPADRAALVTRAADVRPRAPGGSSGDGGARSVGPTPSATSTTTAMPTPDATSATDDGSPAHRPVVGVEVRSARASDRRPEATVAPVGLGLPTLGLDVPVVAVGQDADGRMAVPEDVDDAGWYRHGPAPGRAGNAVIAGHVDDRDQGLGAFHELVDLAVGDAVVVTADDGTTTSWAVTGRELIDKSALDVDALFRRTGPTQLVLVTCGGEFDRARRSYGANVVVVASPVAG